jgi:hypothetical protein
MFLVNYTCMHVYLYLVVHIFLASSGVFSMLWRYTGVDNEIVTSGISRIARQATRSTGH